MSNLKTVDELLTPQERAADVVNSVRRLTFPIGAVHISLLDAIAEAIEAAEQRGTAAAREHAARAEAEAAKLRALLREVSATLASRGFADPLIPKIDAALSARDPQAATIATVPVEQKD